MLSAPPQNAEIRVGSVILARYRVDLILSRGSSPTMMCTRYPDGEKVLVRVLFDPLVLAKGPLLVHLVNEARVVMEQRSDVAQILEFNIDRDTGARCLVMSYDMTATAAQMVDPEGRENRTAEAFVEIARALVERHEHDRHAATPEAARGRDGALMPAPKSRSRPEEPVVRARAKFVDPPPEDTVKGLKRKDLYAFAAFLAAVLVIGVVIFSQDRVVQPPPQLYGWYHDYGTGGAQFFDDVPVDPNDPYANDPDVRAARAMRITIRSSPSGADIWDGMQNLGRTPTEIQRPSRGSEDVLRVSKAGYGETKITVSWDSPRVLSVTLGGGDIGDETAKFIRELQLQNADEMRKIEVEVGASPGTVGELKGPKVPKVDSLPKGLPTIDGKVPELYEDE